MIQISSIFSKFFSYLVILVMLSLIIMNITNDSIQVLAKVVILTLLLLVFIIIINRTLQLREVFYDTSNKIFVLNDLFSSKKVYIPIEKIIKIIQYKSLKKTSLYKLKYSDDKKEVIILFYKSLSSDIDKYINLPR